MDARNLAETPPSTGRRMRRLIPVPSTSTRGPGGSRTAALLVREMRPVQWVKNLACLAGLIFSGRLLWLQCEVQAALAFLSFCFASSSVYILNDILDREKDRGNPRTASRPIASGELPVKYAAVALAVLVITSNAIAAYLGTSCLVALDAYLALNVLYSARLKGTVIVDVMCIALGFVLRVLFGVYGVGAVPTPWIVLCMFFLALFLGFAKRRGELTGRGGIAGLARPVLRKYSEPYLDTLLMITATLAILCYALFTIASHKNPSLIVTILPVVYCVFRYLLHVLMHAGGEAPDSILVKDRRLWAGIASWVAMYVVIDYSGINIFNS